MHTFWQDVRYGARLLLKNPGFAVIAVLTLALGIGANTALFSIVNGVLLSPLPYQQPERLVALYTSRMEFERGSISYPNFLDWRRETSTFSDLAAYRSERIAPMISIYLDKVSPNDWIQKWCLRPFSRCWVFGLLLDEPSPIRKTNQVERRSR
jgi:hypothetical protein